jgi:hypothetical protein
LCNLHKNRCPFCSVFIMEGRDHCAHCIRPCEYPNCESLCRTQEFPLKMSCIEHRCISSRCNDMRRFNCVSCNRCSAQYLSVLILVAKFKVPRDVANIILKMAKYRICKKLK